MPAWLSKSWLAVTSAGGGVAARLRRAIDVAPFWLGGWLLLLEVVALTAIAAVCGWRAFKFGEETHWTYRGLLHTLDENWRGTLILSAALFYRTVHMILSRMKTFYTTWGELAPSGQAEEVQIPPTPGGTP